MDIDCEVQSDAGPGDTVRHEQPQRPSGGIKGRVLKMNSFPEHPILITINMGQALLIPRFFNIYIYIYNIDFRDFGVIFLY